MVGGEGCTGMDMGWRGGTQLDVEQRQCRAVGRGA